MFVSKKYLKCGGMLIGSDETHKEDKENNSNENFVMNMYFFSKTSSSID